MIGLIKCHSYLSPVTILTSSSSAPLGGNQQKKFRLPDLVGNAYGTRKKTKRRSKNGLMTK